MNSWLNMLFLYDNVFIEAILISFYNFPIKFLIFYVKNITITKIKNNNIDNKNDQSISQKKKNNSCR